MPRAAFFEQTVGTVSGGAYLGIVEAVNDPDQRNRVQVRLLHCDGIGEQNAPIWARVAVPFAGSQYGAFLLPHVGEEVLVTFVQGDSRFPVVVGSLFSGSADPGETLGGDRKNVDRWVIKGRAGTRIAIVEESAENATIKMSTPHGVSVTLSDEGGGKIELVAAGSTVTVDAGGFSVQTGGEFSVQASSATIDAPTVSVNAATTTISSMTTCDVMQATAVLGSSYTPGAGQVW